MNIQQAKKEIEHTLRAYHLRDEQGHYRIPAVHQRPILLMGPPGIGKTAILSQIAGETGAGLVAYTLTHHTRQSAVGLPHLEEKTYGSQHFTVTEYTMSEIVASIYDYMEKTGKTEGILFLDEVNCVSETLAPTMLQLLQNKTFGTHRIPEGWILVAAGNPPAYNKSVRDLDIATLDRVRTLNIQPDCESWLDYARENRVHGAILSYLTLHPEAFYCTEDRAEGKTFVTARGWEDLSQLLYGYEALQVPVTQELVGEFLCEPQIARQFHSCYQLYAKYREDYDIPAILRGGPWTKQVLMASGADFEERLLVVELILDRIRGELENWHRLKKHCGALHGALYRLRRQKDGPDAEADRMEKSMAVRLQAGLLTPEEEDAQRAALDCLRACALEAKKNHVTQWEGIWEICQNAMTGKRAAYCGCRAGLDTMLDAAFRFTEEAFGEGQEQVLLMTRLAGSTLALQFIAENGCPAFLAHKQVLQFARQEAFLSEQCRSFQASGED